MRRLNGPRLENERERRAPLANLQLMFFARGQKMSEDITTNVVNEVVVTIIDADRVLHDAMPTGMADVVLAALTAEPETLEELEAAVGRFDQAVVKHGFLKHLNLGVNE